MTILRFPSQAAVVPESPRIRSLIPAWLRSRRADGFRPSGVRAYGERIDHFARFAGDIPVVEIDALLVEEYKIEMSERGLDPGTVRNLLTVLRSFCAFCLAKGYVADNAALAVRHPRVEPPNPDPLAREQIDALLAAIDAPQRSSPQTWQRNRRGICLMLYAGLRLSETTGIERRDIDLDRATITVRREIAKGGRPRVVFACDELLVELEPTRHYQPDWRIVDQGDAQSGTALEPKSFAHYFERTLRRRGLVIHPHQLRKTFATELYLSGADLATIQRLLGHADPKTTIRYIGASSEKEHEAVQKLQFRGEPKNESKKAP